MTTQRVDAGEYAAWVAQSSDEEIAASIGRDREAVLAEIFERMEEHFDAEQAHGLDTVIEWRITGREDGGHDCFQAAIAGGSCRVTRDGDAPARLTVTIRPVDFVKVVTGNVSGPRLFVFRKVRVDGDLMLAGRLATLFQLPEPS